MAGIESQVKVIENVLPRIETSIEKLTELSNSIGKLLAVHEERLDTLERTGDKTENDIRDLHSRITTQTREIVDKIEQVETMIEQKLKDAATNSATQHQQIQADISTKINTLSNRVELLEKWKWIVIGGAMTAGYILDKLIRMIG